MCAFCYSHIENLLNGPEHLRTKMVIWVGNNAIGCSLFKHFKSMFVMFAWGVRYCIISKPRGVTTQKVWDDFQMLPSEQAPINEFSFKRLNMSLMLSNLLHLANSKFSSKFSHWDSQNEALITHYEKKTETTLNVSYFEKMMSH